MSKGGRFGKYGERKKEKKLKKIKGKPLTGKDIIKFDEHRKIAPKHPNMGKK